MNHERILELKRLRGYFAGFGMKEKVKGVDAEIAKLRAADAKAEAKAEAAEVAAEAPVEAAVEPPVVERAVRGTPGRRPRD